MVFYFISNIFSNFQQLDILQYIEINIIFWSAKKSNSFCCKAKNPRKMKSFIFYQKCSNTLCCSVFIKHFCTVNYVSMGAKLAGAVGALAPIDFLVSKSRIYCKFLTSRSRSLEKSGKVSSAPTLFRSDWRPCM